jgi:hypothetical protein
LARILRDMFSMKNGIDEKEPTLSIYTYLYTLYCCFTLCLPKYK